MRSNRLDKSGGSPDRSIQRTDLESAIRDVHLDDVLGALGGSEEIKDKLTDAILLALDAVVSKTDDPRVGAVAGEQALRQQLSELEAKLQQSETSGRLKGEALALYQKLESLTDPKAVVKAGRTALATAFEASKTRFISSEALAKAPRVVARAVEEGIPLAEVSRANSRLAVPIGDGVIVVERAKASPFDDAALETAGRIAHAVQGRLKQLSIISSLHKGATTDELTGLNRRGQTIKLGKHDVDLAGRTGAPISLIFIDVDHFGKLNKEVSHDFGDQVLRTVAQTFSDGTREADIVGRWGGEEFVIVLSGCDTGAAENVAQKLKAWVAAETEKSCDGRRITLSAGVASLDSGKDVFETLVQRADGVQKKAKQGGRDRVVVSFGKGWNAVGRGLGLPTETLLQSVPLRKAIERLGAAMTIELRRLDEKSATKLLENEEFKALVTSLSLTPTGKKTKAVRASAVPKDEGELNRTLSRFEQERDLAFSEHATDQQRREFGETALALSGYLRQALYRIRGAESADKSAALDAALGVTERVLGKPGHSDHLRNVVLPAVLDDQKIQAALKSELGLGDADFAALRSRLDEGAKLAILGEIEGAIGALASARELSETERDLFVKSNYERAGQLITRLGLGDKATAELVSSLRYKDEPSKDSALLGLLQQLSALFEHRAFRRGDGWLDRSTIEKALEGNAKKLGTDPALVSLIVDAARRLELRPKSAPTGLQ